MYRNSSFKSFARVLGADLNTDVIMVWAWMLCEPNAIGTRTLLWFGHACCGNRMQLEHGRYGLSMDAVGMVT